MHNSATTEKQIVQLDLLALNYLRYFENINVSLRIKLCNIFNLPPMQSKNKQLLHVMSNYQGF